MSTSKKLDNTPGKDIVGTQNPGEVLGNNESNMDSYFEHDYEDEEQLYHIL